MHFRDKQTHVSILARYESSLAAGHAKASTTVSCSIRIWNTPILCRAPVIVEAKFGISLVPRAIKNLEEWDKLKLAVTWVDMTGEDAEVAADLRVALRKQGKTDSDFEFVPDLKIENWLDSSAVGA